jgi:hypothetical protein
MCVSPLASRTRVVTVPPRLRTRRCKLTARRGRGVLGFPTNPMGTS